MRLAEVYLIEAEANIEMADGNLELARTDINIIRNRVGMPDVVVTSQSGLRKALRYERTVELCNEGFRWFDLRRWGMASTVMTGKIYAPNQKGLCPMPSLHLMTTGIRHIQKVVLGMGKH